MDFVHARLDCIVGRVLLGGTLPIDSNHCILYRPHATHVLPLFIRHHSLEPNEITML